MSAESVVLMGKVSATGGTSLATSSGNGGGGRVTLKYCSLVESDWAETDCHGGDDHGACMNGGAGTRYDLQTCGNGTEVHKVVIDNQGVETHALTLLDNDVGLPSGVVLNEVKVTQSAALGTRQLSVVATEGASGSLEVSGGCVVVPVGDEVAGAWSSDDDEAVTLAGAEVHVKGSQIVAGSVFVSAADVVEVDGGSSIAFVDAVAVHAGGELNVMVSVDGCDLPCVAVRVVHCLL